MWDSTTGLREAPHLGQRLQLQLALPVPVWPQRRRCQDARRKDSVFFASRLRMHSGDILKHKIAENIGLGLQESD